MVFPYYQFVEPAVTKVTNIEEFATTSQLCNINYKYNTQYAAGFDTYKCIIRFQQRATVLLFAFNRVEYSGLSGTSIYHSNQIVVHEVNRDVLVYEYTAPLQLFAVKEFR